MSNSVSSKINIWLQNTNGVYFTLYATAAAFCTYSCMYAFRKPFTAASYDDYGDMLGLKFKSIAVISQILGYALSKFIGIKVVSELGKNNRAKSILILIALAEIALLGFAVVPLKFKMVMLFCNGLPLGIIWGMVFSFLEGRRFTEAMGAGLCASFALASGFAKSIGIWLINSGVPEIWMPFTTGLIFALPLIFFTWMLSNLPEPSEADEAARTKRQPMNRAERIAFFKTFSGGLILLILVYVLLTAFRSFREDFMREILTVLGYGKEPEIFSLTEIPVTIGVLVLLGLLMFIKSNIRALQINHLVIAFGCATAGISTLLYQAALVGPLTWIMLTGFGTYTAYIPFNCLLFERLIASFKYVSNAGFLIYVADSFGYLGSVIVLIYKDFGHPELSWLKFFMNSSLALGLIGTLLVLISMLYFGKKFRGWKV